MDILLVTRDFRSYGLVSRLLDDGHEVKVYSHSTKIPTFGDGIVTFVSHPLEAIKECKFIIADSPIDSNIYAWAKKFNKPIIGASPLTDLMNTDVYREHQIAYRLGLPLPVTEVIDDVSQMYAKVLDWNPTRTIIRYDRDSITIDHQEWLAWAMHSLPLNKKILLQNSWFGEHLEVVGWFDGLHWARPFILKSLNDTRLKASTMLALFSRDWVEKVIVPWEKFLRIAEYKGPFRVRVAATKEGPLVISTYTGFEFPSLYALIEGLKEPIADFLNRIAFSICQEYDITTDYMSALAVGTAVKEPDGIPIVGLDDGNKRHIFFGSVSKLNSGYIVNKGLPWIYTATAHGRSLDEAIGRTYFTTRRVQIPEPNLMTNLAIEYKPWLARLNNLGYL